MTSSVMPYGYGSWIDFATFTIRAHPPLSHPLPFFHAGPLLGGFPLVTKPSSPTLPVSRPSLLPPRAFTTEQGRPHVILYFFFRLSIFRGCPRSVPPGRRTALRRGPTGRTG